MTINRPFNQRSPNHQPPLTANRGQQNGWLRLVLVLMLIGYWVFAWYMERITLPAELSLFWRALFPFPVPPMFNFLRELFHWRVLRHFLPVIVGWWLAYEAAAGLIKALYDLPDSQGAKRLLSRLIRAQTPAGVPLPMQDAALAAARDQHVLLRVGGPEISVGTTTGKVVTWSIQQLPERSLPVHPTQIYGAINAGLIALLLWFVYPFRRRDGEVFALVLSIYPVTRFLLEIIRDDEPGRFETPLTISQWISVFVVMLSVGLWIYLYRQPLGSRLPAVESTA